MDACTDGIANLSYRNLLVTIAQLLNTDMAATDEILADACTTGIANITTETRLLQVIAQLLQTNGGGGGGGSNNQSGAGNPNGVFVPAYVGQLYIDKTPPYALYMAVGPLNTDWIQAA